LFGEQPSPFAEHERKHHLWSRCEALFTGLVEQLARVEGVEREGESLLLLIQTTKPLRNLRLGESISLNGACLTVVSVDGGKPRFELTPETIRRTCLSDLKTGDYVNVERSLRVGGRLGGHLVTGHVDCVGEIVSKEHHGKSAEMWVKIPTRLTPMMVEKGSIAVDGVSLTIVEIKRNAFSVWLIPHTLRNTTLGFKLPRDRVNIEVDIIAKYLKRFYYSTRGVSAHEPFGGSR